MPLTLLQNQTIYDVFESFIRLLLTAGLRDTLEHSIEDPIDFSAALEILRLKPQVFWDAALQSPNLQPREWFEVVKLANAEQPIPEQRRAVLRALPPNNNLISHMDLERFVALLPANLPHHLRVAAIRIREAFLGMTRADILHSEVDEVHVYPYRMGQFPLALERLGPDVHLEDLQGAIKILIGIALGVVLPTPNNRLSVWSSIFRDDDRSAFLRYLKTRDESEIGEILASAVQSGFLPHHYYFKNEGLIFFAIRTNTPALLRAILEKIDTEPDRWAYLTKDCSLPDQRKMSPLRYVVDQQRAALLEIALNSTRASGMQLIAFLKKAPVLAPQCGCRAGLPAPSVLSLICTKDNKALFQVFFDRIDMEAHHESLRATVSTVWPTAVETRRDETLLRGLLHWGADPNARISTGWPVLCVAVDQSRPALVQALLAKGASLDERIFLCSRPRIRFWTLDGYTAVQLAERKRNPEILAVLRSAYPVEEVRHEVV